MLMPYDVSPDALERDLVYNFFWKFSVFECALKREGFLRAGRNNAAQPGWYEFGKSLLGRFGEVQAAGFTEAVRTLTASSPRRQVVREGRLAWETLERQPDEPEEVFVLRLLKTARNNLFHGGKYPDGQVEEVARDRAILEAGLAVLEGCFELHPGVARWAP